MKAELEAITEIVRDKVEGLQDSFNLLDPNSELKSILVVDMGKLNEVLNHLEKANEAYNEYYTSHIKEVS